MNKSTERIPLLSIICITYNHEKYIAQALDSFLMQKTDFAFEIVIGEDCSKDKTLSIINKYRETFPSLIKVITSDTNVGFVENFRRTLRECKGKYIAICEGDDYWTDEKKIQIQVDFLENNPRYVITYHDAYPFGDSILATNAQVPGAPQQDATQEELINGRSISTLTACFRNIIPEIPHEFDKTPILDLCIWSLLGKFGKGKYLPYIKPAAYRIHKGGIFSTHSIESKKRMTMLTYLYLSEYYARIGNPKVSQGYTFQTALLATTGLSPLMQLRLFAGRVDYFFGSPIYWIKKKFSKK